MRRRLQHAIQDEINYTRLSKDKDERCSKCEMCVQAAASTVEHVCALVWKVGTMAIPTTGTCDKFSKRGGQ